jgi:cytochrome c oxidase subunit III
MTATTVSESSMSKLQMNRIGLWLFMVSEGFLFSGIIVARMSLLGGTRPDLDQTIGLVVTGILLLSSFFVNRAEVAIAHNDRRQFLMSILITIILGLVFVVGVGYEWSLALEEGLTPASGVHGGIFFFMTGMHALHVISGIIYLMVVYYNGLKGHYSADAHWGVEACALYWHFVDVVWVFVYVALYLVGTVVHVAG